MKAQHIRPNQLGPLDDMSRDSEKTAYHILLDDILVSVVKLGDHFQLVSRPFSAKDLAGKLGMRTDIADAIRER